MPPQSSPEPSLPPQAPMPVNSQAPVPAPQQVPVGVTPQKTPMPTWAKVVFIVGASLIALLVVGIVIAVIAANAATKAPQKVSDQFVSDVQAGNTSAAYALTSNTFQQVTSQDQLDTIVQQVGPLLKGQTTVTGRNIQASTGTPTTAVLVYTDKTSSSGTKYIKIELQKNSGVWQVINFKSSPTPLDTTVE